VSRDEAGLRRLFKQFSFPGGIPSHVAPEVPGSIHEGGELGYSLMHAYGAAFDNPDLTVFCVVGDGEAETGPLATSWLSNVFLNPARDGAVLPILHLNGWKIANPAMLARIGDEDLMRLLTGWGYEPILVEGDDPLLVHQALAAAMDQCLDTIGEIRRHPRPLADDRVPHPEGMDGPEGGRRKAGGGHVPGPPGSAERPPRQSRAPAPAGRLAPLVRS
jgi:xylulose-5-phosphate/fructose-6-phosphate phosphoketolase